MSALELGPWMWPDPTGILKINKNIHSKPKYNTKWLKLSSISSYVRVCVCDTYLIIVGFNAAYKEWIGGTKVGHQRVQWILGKHEIKNMLQNVEMFYT